jgi:hypothetical protein
VEDKFGLLGIGYQSYDPNIVKNSYIFHIQERFPRVGHLARQFCAIPLWETDSGDWRTGKKQGSNEHQLSNLHDIDTKNATYAAELMRKDLADQGEEEALQTLTQLLTIRMAILERNGCVLLE